jgi:hypothetical protein
MAGGVRADRNVFEGIAEDLVWSDRRQRPQARSARDDDGQGARYWQGIAVATSGIA